jgi:predicted DNA-binding transcriptional regulator AlpA
MRIELQSALKAATELPAEELPRLLGDLEEIRATALQRLACPAAPPQEDKLLGIDDAAKKLGVSKDYLYRHHAELPFTRRMGKRVVFSALGIEKYIRQHKCLDSTTARH